MIWHLIAIVFPFQILHQHLQRSFLLLKKRFRVFIYEKEVLIRDDVRDGVYYVIIIDFNGHGHVQYCSELYFHGIIKIFQIKDHVQDGYFKHCDIITRNYRPCLYIRSTIRDCLDNLNVANNLIKFIDFIGSSHVDG